jgi:hypothetical protein
LAGKEGELCAKGQQEKQSRRETGESGATLIVVSEAMVERAIEEQTGRAQ